MKTLPAFIILSLLFITGLHCKKSNEPDIISAKSIDEILKSLALEEQNFVFKNEIGATITGKEGTIFSIEPFSYGSMFGDIRISLKEVYNKTQMAANGIFTECITNHMLESLGMFDLHAFKDNSELTAQKEVKVSMKITAGVTPANTKVFRLTKLRDSFNRINKEVWVEVNSPWDMDTLNPNRVTFNILTIGWCNLDKFIDYTVNNKIRISLPDSFGSANCKVYFHLDGVNGLTSLYADYFTKQYYTLAIKKGLSGAVTAVAMIDNQYYYRKLQVVFTDIPQIISMNGFLRSDIAAIEKILKEL